MSACQFVKKCQGGVEEFRGLWVLLDALSIYLKKKLLVVCEGGMLGAAGVSVTVI